MEDGRKDRSKLYREAKALGINVVWNTSTISQLTQLIIKHNEDITREMNRKGGEDDIAGVDPDFIESDDEISFLETPTIEIENKFTANFVHHRPDGESFTSSESAEAIFSSEEGKKLYDKFLDFLANTMEDGKEYIVLINKVYDSRKFEKLGSWVISTKTKKAFLRSIYVQMSNFANIRIDYFGDAMEFVVIALRELPKTNPKLTGFKNGAVNCACVPILKHLNGKLNNNLAKSTVVKINRKIKKVAKINAQYIEHGIDEDGLTELSKSSEINIKVYDNIGREWVSFGDKPKNKTIILHAHEKHFEAVDSVQEITKFENTYFCKDSGEIVPKNIVFLDDDDKFDLSGCSQIIMSKNNVIGVAKPDTIYKRKFNEYEQYPDSFSDGGVALRKFKTDHPCLSSGMYENDPYADLCWDSAVLRCGFYISYSKVKRSDKAFDQTRAYQSFQHSGCYNGIPERINGIKSIKKMASECDLNQIGLAYVVVPKRSFPIKQEKIYFDSSGWVPIEIVRDVLSRGVDVFIECLAIGLNKFNIDVNKYSKAQWRSFVGKCQASTAESVWATNDRDEFLRGLWTLREDVRGSTVPVESDACHGVVDENLPYTITYKSDDKPWCFPLIATYVQAHQKHTIFKKHNELIDAGVEIVGIHVDEIRYRSKKDISGMFDIGSDLGQWTAKPIKSSIMDNGIIYREEIPIPKATIFEDLLPKTRLTHIQGVAGTGKTHTIMNIVKEYGNTVILAPENKLCSMIQQKVENTPVMTYHKYFGLMGTPDHMGKHDVIIFDEISKMSAGTLNKIDRILQEKYNTCEPFGGRYIIIVGDFGQLLPVGRDIVPIWEDPLLYNKFEVITLRKNYRQAKDETFRKICNMLRCYNDVKDGKVAKELMRLLNERVQKPTKKLFSGEDDIFISGVNENVDTVNKLFKPVNGVKVMSKSKRNGIQKNDTGVIRNGNVVFDSGITEPYDEKNHTIAMAITVHKAQGMTYKGNVCIDTSRLFAENHLYVAISRATCLKNIYLTAPITVVN
mgnify:CR=1 FL=1